MAYINLPEGVPGIRALLAFRPETAAPIAALTNVLMCGANTLSPGEREAIAAYVSALNDCTFCRNSHQAIAACHLGDEVASRTVVDPEGAAISPKLKALLAIAGCVQRGGRHVAANDIARARAAGASDVEIHDTVLIAAAFCMFNRYVDGLDAWTPDDPDIYRKSAARVVEHGYVLPS
jgi:uncharacterized peroxidase-related enzyme